MEYHGFHSVREYENECARVGFSTRRIPFCKGGEKYFALVTSPPKTKTSAEAWTLFSADETRCLLDGIINGQDANFLGRLAAHGYIPDDLQATPPAPEYPVGEGGQICLLF